MGIRKSSGTSERLMTISILYVVWVYVAVKTPLRYYNDLLGIGLLGSAVLLAIVLFVINLVAVVTERNLLPFIIFVVCAVVVWSMPGNTPKDVRFAQYRKDYEKVVELARQHKIKHGGDCQQNEYLLPQGYEYLTTDKCVSIKYEPILEVIFFDRTPGGILFYAEVLYPDLFCSGDLGFIEKKVGDHWYICHEYWN